MMKRLVLKACIFLSGLFVVIFASIYISSKSNLLSEFFGKITNSSSYSRERVNGGPVEIIPSIQLAQEQNEYTKVVLGDSVCNRVFNELRDVNDEYLLLGTNQGIGMTGQYLLAEQFLENHDNVTDIYVIMVWHSLDYDFGLKYGYQYAVMPFVETNLFDRLDVDTVLAAEETYGKLFLNKKIVNMIDYSEMNRKIYLNLLYEYSHEPVSESEYLSDIVMRNLLRLDQLCKEHDVALHVLPGPMPDTEENRTAVEEQQKEASKYEAGKLLDLYYESISFYPAEGFPDGVHPGGDWGTRESLNGMIKDLQNKSGLMKDIVFSDVDIYE